MNRYTLGPNPYPGDGHLEYWDGSRTGKFENVDEALRVLLMSYPFPVILTGRKRGAWIPGISLEAPSHSVVQVWCDDPEVVEKYHTTLTDVVWAKDAKLFKDDHFYHDGWGNYMGLLMEIHVASLSIYQKPKMLLIGDGTETSYSSPAGRAALTFSPHHRANLQLRVLEAQLGRARTNHEADLMLATAKKQMAHMREGMHLLNSYCSGVRNLTVMRRGDRESSDVPYHLFQTRVYLGEEYGLIANLQDMDCRDMEVADEWLFAENRWKKLLPLPKCILVSRIRRSQKEYNDPFESAYYNRFNMESLVWIRDGDCVWRFATDVQFEERVFPAGDDMDPLVRSTQEAIWKRMYAPREKMGWPFSKRDDEKEKEPEPHEKMFPVDIKWKDEIEFETLEAFLESEYYTPELDQSIKRRVDAAIRANSRASMPFAMLLQGMIDFGGILNIPPGTDIFDPHELSKNIRLINDFSGVLTDSKNTEQFERFTSIESLHPGDKIIGWRWTVYSEKYSKQAKWNTGSTHSKPEVLTVLKTDPTSQYTDNKVRVHYWRLTKRWVYDGASYERKSPFTKQMASASVSPRFIPLDLPQSLVDRLLEDRAWKLNHKWAIPLLAQWPKVREQLKHIDRHSEIPVPLNMEELK